MTSPTQDGMRRARSPRGAAAAVVSAWLRRDSLGLVLEPWFDVRTDGWAIYQDDECLVSRLPLTETVAISARRFRGITRELVDALRAELSRQKLEMVDLAPPYPVFRATTLEFERAWELRRRELGTDDGAYGAAAAEVVSVWLAGGACSRSVRFLEISVHREAIWACGDCIVIQPPGLRRVAAVSAKPYRLSGPPLEGHRRRARDAVRAQLSVVGLLVRDIKPVAPRGREVRPSHLLEAWEQSRPTIISRAPDPA